MINVPSLLLLALSGTVLSCTLLSGCGGAGNDEATTPGTGRTASAKFSIVWPEATKLVPIASKAVQIDVLQGATKVATKVAARGAAGSTTVINFENIPAGNLTFEASALPTLNVGGSAPTASGVPQAKGSAPLMTEAGKTSKISITMASTIVRLAVFPNPWKLEKLKPSVPARATAYDVQNRVVLTDPNRQFTWTSSNTEVLSVSTISGAVTAREKGFATLTVKDNESGKTATGQVEVVDQVPVDRVVVTPPTATIEPKKTMTLKATALDVDGKDLGYTSDKFTWSSSDPTKATVSASGVVTGAGTGTVTIEVKEKIAGKSGTCVVTVQPLDLGNIYLFGRFNGNEGYGKVLSETTAQFLGAYDYRVRGFSRMGNRRVFFIPSFEGSLSVQRLHVSNLDGTDDRELLHYDSRYLADALPNADGTQLLVMIAENPSFLPDGRRDLLIVDTRTGAKTTLTFPPSVIEPWHLSAWSPTGDRYIMTSYKRDSSGVATWDVGVYNREGQRVKTLAVDEYLMHFSADGSQFVYRLGIPGQPAEIVVCDKDGNQLYRYSVGVDVRTVRYHPTRKTLIYVGHDSSSGFERVYECNPDGSNNHIVFSGTNPLLNQLDLIWQ